MTTDGRRLRRLACCVPVLVLASACATRGADPADPWEPVNRKIFAFNEAADRWVIGPVARGWGFVVPDLAQTGIDNFFENARMPVYVLNNLLQARVDDAVFEVYRFALNASFGIGGFIDVAKMSDWPHYPETFGLTLGHWGVPNGPYVMLPILGPSTVRMTVGRVGDSFSHPYTYFVPFYVPISATALDFLNWRSIYDAELQQMREEAFDLYIQWRSVYLQNLEHRMIGASSGARGPFGEVTADEDDQDLYYFDEYDDEDDEDGGPGGDEVAPDASAGEDAE